MQSKSLFGATRACPGHRKAAEQLLALAPGFNPPPSRHQVMAENLIAAGKRAMAMNQVQLAARFQRGNAGAFGSPAADPRELTFGHYEMPGRQAEHPPQAQRIPLTADERNADERDVQVARFDFGLPTPGGGSIIMTPAQESVLAALRAKRDAVVAKVRAKDPNFDPTPGWWETFEGAVAQLKAEIAEAEKRLRELEREEAEKWRREQGVPTEPDEPRREHWPWLPDWLDPPL